MKIKMLENARVVANRARTLSRHYKDRVYDVSDADAKIIVDSGVAVYAEDGEEDPPKPAPKKKKKKSKNVVEPPIPEPDMDLPPEPEGNSDG